MTEYESRIGYIQNLLERDEDTIREVKAETIREGNKERVKLYRELHEMYFKILYVDEKDSAKVRAVKQELTTLRNTAFVESIYWGRLTENVVRTVVSLDNWIFDKTLYVTDKSERLFKQTQEDADNALKELGVIKNFMFKNMRTGICLNDIDISEEDKKVLEQQRKELLELTKEEMKKSFKEAQYSLKSL